MKWSFMACLIISFQSWGLTVLTDSERYGGHFDSISTSLSVEKRGVDGLDSLIDRLNSSDKKLEQLGKKVLKPRRVPFMVGGDPIRLRMGQKIVGVTIDTALVIEQNLAEVDVLIEQGGVIPEGTKFICEMSGQGKRLKGNCRYMVTPDKTYEIKAILKDYVSGSDLIFPSDVFTTELEAFVKNTHQSVTASLLDDAKDKNETSLGTINRSNTKNRVIGGLIDSVASFNDNSGVDRVKSVTKLTLNAGTKILIKFKQEIKL